MPESSSCSTGGCSPNGMGRCSSPGCPGRPGWSVPGRRCGRRARTFSRGMGSGRVSDGKTQRRKGGTAERRKGARLIPKPSKIVCVGRNYADHAKEMGNEVPKAPLIFLKAPSAMIADGEPIVLPPQSAQVEYEAEIGVVIGRRLRHASPAEAEQGIRGFVCLNDVTARDLQKSDGQWTRAKGFDSFCPVGPRVAEGLAWRELEVIGRVNGRERQRAGPPVTVFAIATFLSYNSAVMAMAPGYLGATATPAGVGPLAPGDVVEVEFPGVGVLKNPVKACVR